MKRITLLIFSSLTVILHSCRTVKCDFPSLPTSTLQTPALPPSSINVPIKADLTNVFQLLETKVPMSFTSDGFPGWQAGDNCRWGFRYFLNRTPFTKSLTGTSITASTLASTGVKARGRPCCGWGFICLSRPEIG